MLSLIFLSPPPPPPTLPLNVYQLSFFAFFSFLSQLSKKRHSSQKIFSKKFLTTEITFTSPSSISSGSVGNLTTI